jgi:CheY-like chemotaxis protein
MDHLHVGGRPSYDFRPDSSVRVLVVDPDADTRTLYRQSFELIGCDVVEAADGREALAVALVRAPDIVVTETRLPFLDGYALCEILRRDRQTTTVPILVVTADARRDVGHRAQHAGANAVLVKPATPEPVIDEMRRLLDESRDARHPTIARAEAMPALVSSERAAPRLSKSFARFSTTTPPTRPPQLVCPSCDQPLTYQHSYVGGVSSRHAEQWDQYLCPSGCGAVEYRHRTRKLRRVS